MGAKNLQWLGCAACEGDGKSRTDAGDNCAVCGGHGALIFCSCCLGYQQYDGRWGGTVCRSCTGEAITKSRESGKSIPEEIEAARAKWLAFEREASVEALKPSVAWVSP